MLYCHILQTLKPTAHKTAKKHYSVNVSWNTFCTYHGVCVFIFFKKVNFVVPLMCSYLLRSLRNRILNRCASVEAKKRLECIALDRLEKFADIRIVLVEAGRLFCADQVSEAEKGKLDLPDLCIIYIFLTANKKNTTGQPFRGFALYWCNKYRNCGTTGTLQSALRSLITSLMAKLEYHLDVPTGPMYAFLFSVVFNPSPPSHHGMQRLAPTCDVSTLN